MTRKRIRENLYIMLFQTNFYEDSDHTQQAEIYLEDLSDPDATKKAKAELKDRFEQVPAGVAINEAVELSKKYGTDKSYRFVNGILASIAKELSKEEEQH